MPLFVITYYIFKPQFSRNIFPLKDTRWFSVAEDRTSLTFLTLLLTLLFRRVGELAPAPTVILHVCDKENFIFVGNGRICPKFRWRWCCGVFSGINGQKPHRWKSQSHCLSPCPGSTEGQYNFGSWWIAALPVGVKMWLTVLFLDQSWSTEHNWYHLQIKIP